MADTEARIRAYNDSEQDQKRLRFYLGKAQMEGLTSANVSMYTNPIFIAVWLGLSSAFVQLLGWWPKPELGFFGYLTPIPAFMCMGLPLIFACDWFNRDDFVNNMNNTLRRRDLVKIKEYYSRSPSSCIYFLEYGTRFVGLIAIDASTDSTSNEVIVSADSRARLSFTKGTSETAVIRHFHVEDPYRVANVQTDLLEFALKHTFEANSKVKSVKATELSLVKYYGKALREQGFKVEGVLDKVGSLGWQRKTWVLGRQTWEKREKRDS